jgi:hypothetical protein
MAAHGSTFEVGRTEMTVILSEYAMMAEALAWMAEQLDPDLAQLTVERSAAIKLARSICDGDSGDK